MIIILFFKYMKNIKNLYTLIFLALFLTFPYKLDAAYNLTDSISVEFTRGYTTRIRFLQKNPTKKALEELIQKLRAETVCASMPEYNRVYFGVIYCKNGKDYDNGIIRNSEDQTTEKGQESIQDFKKKVEKIIGYLETLSETAS
ncbi:MAG: hypothetical protein LVQ75_05500 [Candidatus Babeliales bacterium]